MYTSYFVSVEILPVSHVCHNKSVYLHLIKYFDEHAHICYTTLNFSPLHAYKL